MKPVYIEWLDSHGGEGWIRSDDINEPKLLIKTIGWLVKEHSDYVILTTSYNEWNNILSQLAIPKVAIVKRKIIKL